jgi:integration host factor subunit alpha
MEISINTLESPTLTKSELGALLYEQLGLNKREANDFIEAFFEVILQNLTLGQDVKISGFGNFEIRAKSSRPGRNPKTGKAVNIPARKVIAFKPTVTLRGKINPKSSNSTGD